MPQPITQELFDQVFTEYMMSVLMKMEDASTVDVEKLSASLRPAYLDGFKAGCFVAERMMMNSYIPEPSKN
jgi:hypothetical protein